MKSTKKNGDNDSIFPRRKEPLPPELLALVEFLAVQAARESFDNPPKPFKKKKKRKKKGARPYHRSRLKVIPKWHTTN